MKAARNGALCMPRSTNRAEALSIGTSLSRSLVGTRFFVLFLYYMRMYLQWVGIFLGIIEMGYVGEGLPSEFIVLEDNR